MEDPEVRVERGADLLVYSELVEGIAGAAAALLSEAEAWGAEAAALGTLGISAAAALNLLLPPNPPNPPRKSEAWLKPEPPVEGALGA